MKWGKRTSNFLRAKDGFLHFGFPFKLSILFGILPIYKDLSLKNSLNHKPFEMFTSGRWHLTASQVDRFG